MQHLREAADTGRNIMEPSIACAKAGVTTGEWGETLRQVFGEFRAPTGVLLVMDEHPQHHSKRSAPASKQLAQELGMTPKFLMAKPGLDGHSNGAEQIAVRAADCGLEVTYEGIRLTPEQIVATAKEKKITLIGLSILSGSHVPLIRDVMNRLRQAGLGTHSRCCRRHHSARRFPYPEATRRGPRLYAQGLRSQCHHE